MTYIATFFTHFGAVRFKKLCEEKGLTAQTMPVPRALSSSCGTCVRFEAPDLEMFPPTFTNETEKVVLMSGNNYETVYEQAND